MQAGLLLLNVGLFAAAVAGLLCMIWLADRILEEPGDDTDPGGGGPRRSAPDPSPPPQGPPAGTVRARRDELARSA